jgi:pyruvate dehydrogenase E1 component
VAANVLNLTSPRRLFEAWRATEGRGGQAALDWLLPAAEAQAPIVTVQDGAAHALAWLGGINGARVTSLGVDEFGQSGARKDLYEHFGIDAMSIAEAAFRAVD